MCSGSVQRLRLWLTDMSSRNRLRPYNEERDPEEVSAVISFATPPCPDPAVRLGRVLANIRSSGRDVATQSNPPLDSLVSVALDVTRRF